MKASTLYEMLDWYLPNCSTSLGAFRKGPVKQLFKRKIAVIFLSVSLNMCFGCSKETLHQGSSFEYPQHMFWLRNKKINF